MSAEWKGRVEAATVRLPKLGGQGVLVPGGFVLTATHCVQWDSDGGMPLGDHYLEPVVTNSGASFRLSPHAVEAVADIAVLGEADNQTFAEDAEAFEEWRDSTEAVSLSSAFEAWCLTLDGGTEEHSFPVHVLTHKGEWVAGQVKRFGFQDTWAGSTFVYFEHAIHGGTSGGPIVDGDGELVGVVSIVQEVETDEPCEGIQPIVAYALPQWVLRRIKAEVPPSE